MKHYDESILSDLHKDAYGTRPGEYFWSKWNNMSEAEREAEWNMLCDAMNDSIEHEKRAEARALSKFEESIVEIMKVGAKDRQTALRWITEGEEFSHAQDIEHWVWKQGILFTENGKVIMAELANVWNIKVWSV